MRFVWAALAAIVLLAMIALGYGTWRYLFDPQGISLAASETCVVNETARELVLIAHLVPGSKQIALLDTAEQVCAQSPVRDAMGSVQAGEVEDDADGCQLAARAGQVVRLIKWQAGNRCEWSLD